MKLKKFNLIAALILSVTLMSCSDQTGFNSSSIENEEHLTDSELTHLDAYVQEYDAESMSDLSGKSDPVSEIFATLTENFETGSKTSYAAANVTLGSGVWNLSNALLGTSTSDRKVGTKSARITSTGTMTMQYNKSGGAGTVSVKHAKFGSDGNSTWELWSSTNNGSTWTKVGSTITTSSTSLLTVSFTVNISATVRFQIRKVSGGSNRINFDDFSITDFTSYNPINVHATFGNPSQAVTNTSYPTNYYLVKTQYVMAYHRDRAVPNWVAWHLDPSWLGSTPRQDDFRQDNTLPTGWYRVGSTSYSGSGFDRGHITPSADRTNSVANNSATFLMTNMMPQSPDNNQGPWARLEDYERTLVSQGNELYIYAGSYGTGGTGSNGTASTINNGNITVPNRTWKVIVVLPQGSNDVSRVTTSTRVIAVDMPNTQGIRSVNWGTYRVKVDQIEAATGLNLLDVVPAAIQNTIENIVDTGATS